MGVGECPTTRRIREYLNESRYHREKETALPILEECVPPYQIGFSSRVGVDVYSGGVLCPEREVRKVARRILDPVG